MHCIQPEMSRDVQRYDRNVYLRVSEAQRCRVQSTLLVPVFAPEVSGRTVAVFEIVQSDRGTSFSKLMAWLERSLQVGQTEDRGREEKVGRGCQWVGAASAHA